MDVSIIVPLYKGKKYIPLITKMAKENQKVLVEKGIFVDIEIIFVNDYPGEKINDSDLNSSKNISQQLHTNEYNIGILGSRQKGLSKASGSYIVFLDQDDEVSPFYLWRQLQRIGEADAVLCNGFYRDNRRIYKDQEQQRQTICKDYFIKRTNIIISPGQVLIRKNAIPRKWLNLKLEKNGSDDVLLWILMLCEEKTFVINPFDDYKHIEDGENMSLNFINMKASVEEMLSVVKSGHLLENNADFLLFENTSLERIRKYELYIHVNENWENIVKRIIELCRLKKKTAIYGYGVIGKRLYRDLENEGVKIDLIIDRAAENFTNTGCKIYQPEKVNEKIDLIIITPLFAEEQIRKDVSKFGSMIVSLNEVESNHLLMCQ